MSRDLRAGPFKGALSAKKAPVARRKKRKQHHFLWGLIDFPSNRNYLFYERPIENIELVPRPAGRCFQNIWGPAGSTGLLLNDGSDGGRFSEVSSFPSFLSRHLFPGLGCDGGSWTCGEMGPAQIRLVVSREQRIVEKLLIQAYGQSHCIYFTFHYPRDLP